MTDLDLLKKAGETNALSRWAHGEIERLREELARNAELAQQKWMERERAHTEKVDRIEARLMASLAREDAYRDAIKAQPAEEPAGYFQVNEMWGLIEQVNIAFKGDDGVFPLFRAPQPSAEVERKYHELLYAVQKKHPDESRHETALRYIQQAELNQDSAAMSKGEK